MAVLEARWVGPILDCSGYAAAARGYLMSAEAAGIRLRPEDASRSMNLRGRGLDDHVFRLYERMRQKEVSPYCPVVCHQVADLLSRDPRAKASIGYTIFEMREVPPLWVRHCNEMDEIWTGSTYSKEAFLSSGVNRPVRVLPHAIDTSLFCESAEPWPVENRRSFCFVSAFDFTERKAWKDLLKAFWMAFDKKDDVALLLKAYFGSFSQAAIRNVAMRISKYRRNLRLQGRAPVLLYGHAIPQSQMPGFYTAGDCYVGISREGFGLPYAEAMACGLPCIGPEVGGTREFMSPDNSFLIRHSGDSGVGPETAGMYPQFAGLHWPNHSWEHLSEVMRKVAQDGTTRSEVARKGSASVRAQLSPSAIGGHLAHLLEGSRVTKHEK